MSDFRNYSTITHGVGAGRALAIDEGLRAYMIRVYNYMAMGVAGTAVITLLLMNNPSLMQTIALGPMKWVLFFSVLGLGWFAARLIYSGGPVLAHGAYWLCCALTASCARSLAPIATNSPSKAALL